MGRESTVSTLFIGRLGGNFSWGCVCGEIPVGKSLWSLLPPLYQTLNQLKFQDTLVSMPIVLNGEWLNHTYIYIIYVYKYNMIVVLFMLDNIYQQCY